MMFTRYESYKESGVEWLREIPTFWKPYRFQGYNLIQTSNVDKKSDENEEEVLLCNYNDVYKNDFITKSLNFYESYCEKKRSNK